MTTAEEATAETDAFLDANWDPDLTVADWWQRLADAQLSHPMLPEEAGGRSWSRSLMHASQRAMAVHGALGPPMGLGMMLAAPTIAAFGDADQIERLVKPILNGQVAWCQLFSEPGAGSDLAGLQTKAELDGDEWTVNGQKVWTSSGHVAQMGMLIARSDPEQPKHQGITYYAFDMTQPGVDVRPLKEMTGRALFNEVFMTDTRVNDTDRIGDRGNGWRVANFTLMTERESLGSGSSGVITVHPGPIAGNLDKRAGDFVEQARVGETGLVGPKLFEQFRELAVKLGRTDDAVLRDKMMQLWQRIEVNRLNMLRAKAGGSRTGAEGNLAKLATSEITRRFREVGNELIGADGMLGAQSSTTNSAINMITLFSPATSIYGGSDQVQRNIIGERILGLPKEPGPAKETPFSELPKNQ